MKIDKSKLKIGIWYEDKDGNVMRQESFDCSAPKGAHTYHTLFPLSVTEEVYEFHSEEQKRVCKHKRKWLRKDRGLIKGLKGRTCINCGCSQTRKWYEPWGRKWDNGSSVKKICDCRTSIGCGDEDVILAMANSGDYTLSEAIAVYANACERCVNVLAFKYLGESKGYVEGSLEWQKANTICEFCKDMGNGYEGE